MNENEELDPIIKEIVDKLHAGWTHGSTDIPSPGHHRLTRPF